MNDIREEKQPIIAIKPMLPAGSYVTLLGGLYVTMHDVKMV
jgi:hypothetical protein